MRLRAVTIERFRNFVEPQRFIVEDSVTALVGKNEAGKTAILHALFRLNPANRGTDRKFDPTVEYPRWHLPDDRASGKLDEVFPIKAEFELDETDRSSLELVKDVPLPAGTVCVASKGYDNELQLELRCGLESLVTHLASFAGVEDEDLRLLASATDLAAFEETATSLVAKHAEDGSNSRASSIRSLSTRVRNQGDLLSGNQLTDDQLEYTESKLPKFFYFSDYSTLPGKVNLDTLLRKPPEERTPPEDTAVALLGLAGVGGAEFQDVDLESRTAELEAAALRLTRQVLEYWRTNRDIKVHLTTDLTDVSQDGQSARYERFLDIRLEDLRHGGVTTNFQTRSAGFQWFFSFLAAFDPLQNTASPLIVLLDEPGTSLHGEAQQDFLRFIFEKLGASQQVIYTTHSQYMIDAARFETIRAVDDLASRDHPDLGAQVGPIQFSTDRDTVLPLQAALGGAVSQDLMIGAPRHLVVEGSSDFIYLSAISTHLGTLGRETLDPRFGIIPVGGADKIPAFVALFGRYIPTSVLADGSWSTKHGQRLADLVKDGLLAEDQVVFTSSVEDIAKSSDIEDLFTEADYQKLLRGSGLEVDLEDQADGNPRIVQRVARALGGDFDHGLPARALAQDRAAFFDSVEERSLDRFEELFRNLNETIR